MTLRLIFAGTPDFSSKILETLLKTNHKILAVYTQPDRPAGRGRHLSESPVKTLSLQHQLQVFQPLDFKEETEIARLKNLNADLMIVAAYGLLLPKAVLTALKFGCINIHVSLLPRWRGASPVQHAILAGDNQTGITIMQMDEGLDTGDILGTYPCAIETKETGFSLYQKLSQLAQPALIDTLEKLERGEVKPQKQNSENATYAHKIRKSDARIDWNDSAAEIDRKIRAYVPWPIAFTSFEGNLIRIFQAEPIYNHPPSPSSSNTPSSDTPLPGSILSLGPEGIEVATSDGSIRIKEIQFEGRKRLAVKDILNSKSNLFKIGAFFD